LNNRPRLPAGCPAAITQGITPLNAGLLLGDTQRFGESPLHPAGCPAEVTHSITPLSAGLLLGDTQPFGVLLKNFEPINSLGPTQQEPRKSCSAFGFKLWVAGRPAGWSCLHPVSCPAELTQSITPFNVGLLLGDTQRFGVLPKTFKPIDSPNSRLYGPLPPVFVL
jgi:hypothetical protein